MLHLLLQAVLIKQEKVPCLIDNDAHLALDSSDPFTLQTKPHGHGDVHGLLHRSGLAKKWQNRGLKWVCFFQVRNKQQLIVHHLIGVNCNLQWSHVASGCKE